MDTELEHDRRPRHPRGGRGGRGPGLRAGDGDLGRRPAGRAAQRAGPGPVATAPATGPRGPHRRRRLDRRARHHRRRDAVAARRRAPAAHRAHRGGRVVGGRDRVRARGLRAPALPHGHGRQPARAPRADADHRAAAAHRRGDRRLRGRGHPADVPRRAGGGASLLASAGLISIVAGLAAQTSLANVFAGMQIAFTDAIRVDDVVVLEGEWGRIEEITMTYVVVHLWDDRRLIMPSTYFTTTPFQNWTRRAADLLGTVELDLDFEVPVGPMRAELRRLLGLTDLWDERVGILQVTDAVGGSCACARSSARTTPRRCSTCGASCARVSSTGCSAPRPRACRAPGRARGGRPGPRRTGRARRARRRGPDVPGGPGRDATDDDGPVAPARPPRLPAERGARRADAPVVLGTIRRAGRGAGAAPSEDPTRLVGVVPGPGTARVVPATPEPGRRTGASTTPRHRAAPGRCPPSGTTTSCPRPRSPPSSAGRPRARSDRGRSRVPARTSSRSASARPSTRRCRTTTPRPRDRRRSSTGLTTGFAATRSRTPCSTAGLVRGERGGRDLQAGVRVGATRSVAVAQPRVSRPVSESGSECRPVPEYWSTRCRSPSSWMFAWTSPNDASGACRSPRRRSGRRRAR